MSKQEQEPDVKQAALAVRNAMQVHGLDLNSIGTVLVQSGFFPDAQKVSQAVVKIMAGRELGIGPVRAMQTIHFYDGQIDPDASIYTTLMRRHPDYNYKVEAISNERCAIAFYLNGDKVGVSEFTMDDAERAGLAKKRNWQTYRRNMLFARAMKNGVKWYAPDVLDYGWQDYDWQDTPQDLAQADMGWTDREAGALEIEKDREIQEGLDEMTPEELEAAAEDGKRSLFSEEAQEHLSTEGITEVQVDLGVDLPDEPSEDPPLPGTAAQSETEERMPNQWPDDVVERAVELGLSENEFHARNVLNLSPLLSVAPGQLRTQDAIAYFVAWHRIKQSRPDLDSQSRAAWINGLWEDKDTAYEEWQRKAADLLGEPGE